MQPAASGGATAPKASYRLVRLSLQKSRAHTELIFDGKGA